MALLFGLLRWADRSASGARVRLILAALLALGVATATAGMFSDVQWLRRSGVWLAFAAIVLAIARWDYVVVSRLIGKSVAGAGAALVALGVHEIESAYPSSILLTAAVVAPKPPVGLQRSEFPLFANFKLSTFSPPSQLSGPRSRVGSWPQEIPLVAF